MAIIEQDSRTDTADRIYQEFVRRGADPHAVKALLPNLVSSRPEVSARAERWLTENAMLGNDLSDEGVRLSRQVVNAARQFHQQSLERGDFAGEPAYKTGSRYGAPEADLDAELERQSPTRAYPGANTNNGNLRLGELEADAQARHRRHDLTLMDDGRLLAPDGTVVEQLEVPQYGPAPLTTRDTASGLRAGNPDGTTYYKNTSDEDAEAYWARNGGAPFGG